MIADFGYMVTMTKSTTTDTNIPVICFHLMEIALHSDMSATSSHVRRSNQGVRLTLDVLDLMREVGAGGGHANRTS